MSFVAVAAINHPDLDRDGNICEEDAALTKNKMRTMLRIGLLNGHDSIVLGAFGCGAFHNPPKHIARLFHEVIDEKEFKDKYKLIAFAILEDHNSPEVETCNPSSRNSSHKLPQIWLSFGRRFSIHRFTQMGL